MSQQIIVTVQVPNINGKAIVSTGDRFFIIIAGGYYRQQEIMIDLDDAVEMPSFLYALGAIDLTGKEAIKFIKEYL